MSPPTNSVEWKRQCHLRHGRQYTLNRKCHGTDGVERFYRICTVSGCKAIVALHDQKVKNSPIHNHGDHY